MGLVAQLFAMHTRARPYHAEGRLALIIERGRMDEIHNLSVSAPLRSAAWLRLPWSP
jgi:hypothetical protein